MGTNVELRIALFLLLMLCFLAGYFFGQKAYGQMVLMFIGLPVTLVKVLEYASQM